MNWFWRSDRQSDPPTGTPPPASPKDKLAAARAKVDALIVQVNDLAPQTGNGLVKKELREAMAAIEQIFDKLQADGISDIKRQDSYETFAEYLDAVVVTLKVIADIRSGKVGSGQGGQNMNRVVEGIEALKGFAEFAIKTNQRLDAETFSDYELRLKSLSAAKFLA